MRYNVTVKGGMTMLFKGLKVVLGLVFVSLIAFGLLIIVLQVTDYKPDQIETMDIHNAENVSAINMDETYDMITFNIGYCGLGANEDFFMDGGNKAKADNLDTVIGYFESIKEYLQNQDVDIIALQEVDINSDRTFALDEYQAFSQSLDAYSRDFAYNYKVLFVPVPWPPMGMVHAGQATYGKFTYESAERLALPSDFPWPQNLVMLDRCVTVTQIPVEGSGSKLIVMNAHFSAYDDGTLRIQQMEVVKNYMSEAYKAGNFVVLAGDFNQTFPGVDESQFPMYLEGKFYKPYQIEDDFLPEGWQWGVDYHTPTYRLLNAAYIEGETQVGIIDGFVVSPNIDIVSVKTDNLSFAASDHNPVKLEFKLKP